MRDARVVVIGAGVGGLVSAALLAARGYDVTVLEKAATPGGKLRQLDGIDGGPTVFTLRGLFDEIFAECGGSLYAELTIRPAQTIARHAWGQARLDLHGDPEASEDAIGAFAGAAEARGYRAFRAEAQRIYDALNAPFMQRSRINPLGLGWRMATNAGLGGLRDYATLHPYTSLWTALGKYFADPRLRQLFGRYATYCGSSPFKAPSTLMLISHVEARGVWTIDGGMHKLAAALEALGKRNGARFRYGTPVERIIVERGRAAGVVLQGGERIAATHVICNADPAALGAGMFGEQARRAASPVAARHRSLSAMVWTARAKTEGFPLDRHNVFFSPDYAAEFKALGAGRLAADPSVYVCAQDRADNRPAHEGPERIQIIVNAPPTGDGPPLDPAEIAACQARMLERLETSGLTLELEPSATRLTTPWDFANLFPSTGGALYGRASHGWAASFLRQSSRTRIPGIYCAGGSTHPGAGVPMAALSARLAADCLLQDRASMFGWTRKGMLGGISMPPAATNATA